MKTLTEQYILKSRTGVYQDTSENRRKHRVGQHYGEAKKEGEEGKLSKREQREVRLASYKDGLKKLEDRLKEGSLSDSTREKIEGLRDTLKGKISKLEEKLSRGGKKVSEKPKTSPVKEEVEKKSDVQEPSWDKQEAFFKEGTDEYELLDNLHDFLKRRDPFYQRTMQKIFEKKSPNIDEWKLTPPAVGVAEIRAIVDGKEVASINLNNASVRGHIPMLQTFMDECHKAEKKSGVKAPVIPPNYDLPDRGRNVDFMMGDVHVKIENPTQYASNGKDIYRVTISKDGKQVEQVASAVPATIKKVIEKYGSGNEEKDFEAFAEKFEKNYRRDPNRTVPTKSSEIRELARKEWER